MKAQTKALMASAVVTVLALSAVAGVTYSWFSDTETSDITISSAKIDIDGEYTGVEVVKVGGGDVNDTKATLTTDKKNIDILNLVGNRMITANYILTNSSTVDVLYRMYITVDGVTDAVANKMISITGGPSDFVGELNFKDGVAYVGGSSGTVLNVPVGDDAGKYSFTLTIDSSDLTSCNDFKIKIVNEAYQYDYKYSLVKVISKTGEASLPTGTATDSVSFIGTAPAESGASAASAADTNVTFTAGALNMVTDNGNNAVTLKTEMLDPVNGVAKIKLTLENAKTTNFGNEYATVSVSIPGKYTNLTVVYNGNGDQPETVSCVYDSEQDVTNVTFRTNHFSEFEIVDGSIAMVSDKDSFITALSSGVSKVVLVEDISYDTANEVGSRLYVGTEDGQMLNLNGHNITIKSEDKDPRSNFALFYVDGTFIVEGDGKITTTNDDCTNCLYGFTVLDGGHLTIKGGEYYCGGTVVQLQSNHNDVKSGATAEYSFDCSCVIEGGKFTVAPYGEPYGCKFVLNYIDALNKAAVADGKQLLIVKGGEFVNYDPSSSNSENPEANFLAEWYVSVKSTAGEDTAYNIVPAVAKIGGKYFLSLTDAIVAATGENVTIELSDGVNVTLDNGVANEGDKSRNVTILGNGTQTVDIITKAVSAEGGMLNYQRGSTFTFENVNIVAGEGDFDGIVCGKLSFNNCTITGKLTLYGEATFTNCTFENTMANQYSIWTWGGTDVTFEGCTFNTNGKAILLYGQATAAKPTNLVVKDCVFNDRNNGSAEKAAIEIGNDYKATYSLTIDNITVNGFADGKNTGSKYWANKNSMDAEHLSVTIDGTKVL